MSCTEQSRLLLTYPASSFPRILCPFPPYGFRGYSHRLSSSPMWRSNIICFSPEQPGSEPCMHHDDVLTHAPLPPSDLPSSFITNAYPNGPSSKDIRFLLLCPTSYLCLPCTLSLTGLATLLPTSFFSFSSRCSSAFSCSFLGLLLSSRIGSIVASLCFFNLFHSILVHATTEILYK